jgi:hypothetical protein
MKVTLLARVGFALLTASAAALLWSDNQVRMVWYPTYVNDSEGIYIHFEGHQDLPLVTVEGEADGKPLPVTAGYPNEGTSFLATPIKNLNTYRIIRLSLKFKSRVVQLDKPIAGEPAYFNVNAPSVSTSEPPA